MAQVFCAWALVTQAIDDQMLKLGGALSNWWGGLNKKVSDLSEQHGAVAVAFLLLG